MLRNGAAYIWDDEMKVPYAIHVRISKVGSR